jgi:hypothetical protein
MWSFLKKSSKNIITSVASWFGIEYKINDPVDQYAARRLVLLDKLTEVVDLGFNPVIMIKSSRGNCEYYLSDYITYHRLQSTANSIPLSNNRPKLTLVK